MNKLIHLDHLHNKRAFNLVIFILKEEEQEYTLAIVKAELHSRIQIDTIVFAESLRLGKSIENK